MHARTLVLYCLVTSQYVGRLVSSMQFLADSTSYLSKYPRGSLLRAMDVRIATALHYSALYCDSETVTLG